MSRKKLETRVVIVPNAGQFLINYIEDKDQDYAHKPTLGFGADIQKRPDESEYSGSNIIGFTANNNKKPVEIDELAIWEQAVKGYIEQKLSPDEPDNQYKKTRIGFGSKIEKPQRYTIKVTPINHIIVPTKPQQL